MRRRKDKIYAGGVFACVFLLYIILCALFPEQAAAAEKVEDTEWISCSISCNTTYGTTISETDTTKSGIIDADFAENPQNGTINGQIGTPSGYPDELSAMPCCMISNTSNALDALEEDDGFRIYRIAGEIPDPELQRAIYDALLAAEIPYWYEGALAQCFQESHFQRFAVNQRNGIDSGLFQYRSTFWDWSQGDIFDADAQIRMYAAEMAARFNAGLSADEAISRHKTSDYCTEIDWEYVRQVRQWLGQMEVVE